MTWQQCIPFSCCRHLFVTFVFHQFFVKCDLVQLLLLVPALIASLLGRLRRQLLLHWCSSCEGIHLLGQLSDHINITTAENQVASMLAVHEKAAICLKRIHYRFWWCSLASHLPQNHSFQRLQLNNQLNRHPLLQQYPASLCPRAPHSACKALFILILNILLNCILAFWVVHCRTDHLGSVFMAINSGGRIASRQIH